MILAVLALAEDPAYAPRTKALAVLLLAFSFFALAAFLDLIEFYPDFEPILNLRFFLLKGLGVSSKSINDRFLMALVGRAVPTVHTVAVLVTEDLKMEALTVHLETFRFSAIAANLLKLGDFIRAFAVAHFYFHTRSL